MKKVIIFLNIVILPLILFSNPKFEKWQIQGYFRGYNVLYETPKNIQDIIDFRNYGGNLMHIQPDGFLNPDPPYDTLWNNVNGADMLVDLCRQAGVYYVIAMRSGPGAYDTYDESQGTTGESRIWNTGNTTEQQKYAEMLKMIVQRYGNDTLFAGINMVIEPRPKVRVIPANTSQLYKFFLETIHNIHMDQVYNFWVSQIRQVDPLLPIISESFAYSTPELFPPYELNDPYIIYSFHNYQPVEYSKEETPMTMNYPGSYWNITHLSQQIFNGQFIRETVFGKVKEFQEQTGAPILLGEFGMFKPQINCHTYVDDVLSACTENGWHFALWDWRRSGGPEWNFEKFSDQNDTTWKTVLSKFHAPPVPGLIYPINGENANTNPEFRWDSLTSFTTYDLWVFCESWRAPVIFSNIPKASYIYDSGTLTKGLTYYWKIRAKNPGGNAGNISEWSKQQSFYIPVPDSHEKKQFVLGQNSPNPFNPSTNISFNIPKQSIVRLAVYDILGREVVKLADENMQAGNYSKIFDASNLPSGVYFYRLIAEPADGSTGFSEIKRMILVK